jgi:5-formyltetrahydrofolate cyclo-ligase
MHAVYINEETVYQRNAYGLTEPKSGEPIDPGDIDVIFVPLLACDITGHRVGYGKGFYDKFLVQCNSDVVKIAFSYFEPVDKIDDADVFDVPLDFCITPEKVYEF